ncbi:hypothetical protein [Flagellimonas marina]|uniref:Uncharacterized protein n=1 Tax=Flagellimonas marina TaxID=1775168 RepID=A0ABV8PGC9_9FLAO
MNRSTKKPSKRCTCGNQKRDHESCPNCSRYKMVFLLRDPNSPYKVRDPKGNLVNPVFWSFLKEDKKPLEAIKKNMLERARKRPIFNHCNKIGLYDRMGNQLEMITV